MLVVAGNLSVRDLVNDPHPPFARLVRSGSLGLMNVRTGRPTKDVRLDGTTGMESGCVSLGAGAMAVGGLEVRGAGDPSSARSGGTLGELYTWRTGRAFGSAAVVQPEIVRITRINESASYHAIPGALGSALNAAGIRTAAIGNSDLTGESHREAAAVAMNTDGLVDCGTVDSPSLVVHDPREPFGVRTDTRTLLAEVEKAGRTCRFIVVDFGDTFRADRYAEWCSDERAASAKRRANARLQDFLVRLYPGLDPTRDLLILLSPASRVFSDIEGEKLGLVLVYGPGFSGGTLTSASTRRDGVVTICDVPPTVLDFLGVRPPRMDGRPIRRVAQEDAGRFLLDLNLRASNQAQRQVAMRGGSVVQSIVVVLVTLAAVAGTVSVKARRAGAWLALVPVALPLAMIYLPAIYTGGLEWSAALLAILTAAILGSCYLLLRTPLRALAWLCGAVVVSLVIDLLRGAPLISQSIAGYSLVEGARYYGLGNELMGTLLGAALAGSAVLLPAGRVWNVSAAAAFAAVFVCIGAPGLGADLGGAIASAPAMAVVILVRSGWKPTLRGAVAIGACAALAVGVLFALDVLQGRGAQSHAGRLASGSDLLALLHVIQRKVGVNLMLLSTSLWSKLLILSLLGSTVLAYWRVGDTRPRLLDQRAFAAAAGCVVGIAGAFLFNDSGVLAAATCAVFLWAMLALTRLAPG